MQFGVPYEGQLWAYRAASFLLPVAACIQTRRACERLREGEGRPGRDWGARAVARNREGAFEELKPATSPGGTDPEHAPPPSEMTPPANSPGTTRTAGGSSEEEAGLWGETWPEQREGT